MAQGDKGNQKVKLQSLQAVYQHIHDGMNELKNDVSVKASANDLADTNVLVDELQERMGKVETVGEDATERLGLAEERLDAAESELDSLSKAGTDYIHMAAALIETDRHCTQIAGLEGRTEQLENSIATKAEQNDLAAAHAELGVHAADLKQIHQILEQKAEQNNLAAITAELDMKAPVRDVLDLQRQVAMKADSNVLASAHTEINRLQQSAVSLYSRIGSAQSAIADMDGQKVNKPSVDGTPGQVLMTNGNGTTSWTDASAPTDEQIGEAVSDWLTDHPEATTTVEDGSITETKLAPEVLAKIGEGNDIDAQVLSLSLFSELRALTSERADTRENVTVMTQYLSTLKTYASRFLNNGFGFLFFTDPHNLDRKYLATPYRLLEDFRFIRNIYEHTPAKYVFCGGDWLNIGHTLHDATWLVGRVQHLMRTEIGEGAWTVYGNHDDNQESGVGGKLTEQQLARMWYGRDKLYFILDAAEDLDIYMLNAGYSTSSVTTGQVDEMTWLCQKLLANTKTHLFGVGHIFGHRDSAYLGALLFPILDAFNQRSTVEIDGVLYDFSEATGTWHFLIGGHEHRDINRTVENIPVIITTTFYETRAMDLCYADWDDAVLTLERVGDAGESRSFPIIPTGGYAVSQESI